MEPRYQQGISTRRSEGSCLATRPRKMCQVWKSRESRIRSHYSSVQGREQYFQKHPDSLRNLQPLQRGFISLIPSADKMQYKGKYVEAKRLTVKFTSLSFRSGPERSTRRHMC